MTNLYSRECILCRKVLGEDDDIIITHDFFAPSDLLSEYANVAMHLRCFMFWSRHQEFWDSVYSSSDVVRLHQRTPEGLMLTRFERQRNQVILPKTYTENSVMPGSAVRTETMP